MYQGMWYTMEKTQNGHDLSDRLIRSICSWHSYGVYDESEDIDDLIDMGADVNRMHGTILPLHCTCMVSDEESLLTLIKRGARVSFKKCLSIDIYLRMYMLISNFYRHYTDPIIVPVIHVYLFVMVKPFISRAGACKFWYWYSVEDFKGCLLLPALLCQAFFD